MFEFLILYLLLEMYYAFQAKVLTQIFHKNVPEIENGNSVLRIN